MPKSKSTRFWPNFATGVWEKESCVVKNFESPLRHIGEAAVFSMLIDFADQCRRRKSAEGFKIYIDGHLQHPDDTLQFLPRKTDKTLRGYHLRMETAFASYCLVCDELLQTGEANWSYLQEFADTLFDHVGIPNRFVEMGLYVGNYRVTPFGVHVDNCGVFSFPVVGQKTFRLWSPEFAKAHPSLHRTQRYSKFKTNSKTLTVGPGDMAYWPSSAWHVAESDGSFTATWSLGVWVDQTHQSHLEKALQPLLKSKLGVGGARTTTTISKPPSAPGPSVLPDSYRQSIALIQSLSQNELHDAFLAAWLQLKSMNGFKTVPQVSLPAEITLQSRIFLPPTGQIHWAHLKAKTKCIFSHRGTNLETETSTQFLALVNALNSGQTCLIADFLKGSKRRKDLASLNTLLIPNVRSDPPNSPVPSR